MEDDDDEAQAARAEAAAVMIQARIRGAQARKGLFAPKPPKSFLLDDEDEDEIMDLPDEDGWQPPSTSLWCLSVHTPLRKVSIHIMTHPAFDIAVLAIIIANSVAMAMEDPLESPDHPSTLTKGLHLAEAVFNVSFTVEMIVKIVAMGFVSARRHSYLRNGWNVMDFVIVVSSWIPYVLPDLGGNGSGLRTFRLLRPLRSISRFPGLKALVETIMMAIPQLGNIMLLTSIYFLTFGIVAVQLWKGNFHNRCGSLQYVEIDGCNATSAAAGSTCSGLQWLYAQGYPEYHPQFVAAGYGDVGQFGAGMNEADVAQAMNIILPMAGADVRTTLQEAIRLQDVEQRGAQCFTFEEGGHACAVYAVDAAAEHAEGVVAGFCNHEHLRTDPELTPADGGCSSESDAETGLLLEQCIQIRDNPYWGLVSWDNILLSFVLIYQVVTITSWQEYMYMTQQTSGFMVWIYFVGATLIGAYFLINLFVAVLKEKFDQVADINDAKEAAEDDDGEDGENYPTVYCEFLYGRRFGIQCPLEDIHAAETCLGYKDKLCEDSMFMDQMQNLEDSDAQNPLVTDPGQRVLCFKGVPIPDAMSLVEAGVAPDGLVRLETSAFRLRFKAVVQNSAFTNFYTGMILLNTFVLASDHHQIDADFADSLDSTNYALTLLFTFEVMAKLAAYTPGEFGGDAFNSFDFCVVAAGLLELLASGNSAAGAFRAFRIFRLFRVLRVLRLISFLAPLKKIGRVVVKTLGHLGYILTLLLLFTYIFTILGMQMFGGKFVFDGEVPRANFDSFILSLFTVVQVLTFDAWNGPLMDGVKAQGWASSIYFFMWILLGSFVLLNLLLVIILDAYVEVAEEIKEEEERAAIGRGDNEATFTKTSTFDIDGDDDGADQGNPMSPEATFANPLAATLSEEQVRQSVLDVASGDRALDRTQIFILANVLKLRGRDATTGVDNDDVDAVLRASGKPDTMRSPGRPGDAEIVVGLDAATEWAMRLLRERRGQLRSQLEGPALAGADEASFNYVKGLNQLGMKEWSDSEIASIRNKACGCLGMDSALRKACFKIALSKRLDSFILVVIVLNCMVMAMETPHLSESDDLFHFLFYCDLFFSFVFTSEMCIKIVAFGFVKGETSYLADNWNRLDFIIVMISLLDLAAFLYFKHMTEGEAEDFALLKAFRLLRAFRPLRMLTKMKGLQMLVNSLLASVAALMNVLGVTLLIWLIFGILGINLFKGMFWRCTDPDVAGVLDCVGSVYDPETQGIGEPRWYNPESNFDHIGNSLFSLYEISTADEWIEVAYNGIDAVDIGVQPRINYLPSMLFYFIAFIVVCNFVFLNLFIGVIYEEYVALKNQGIFSLAPGQKAWYSIQVAAANAKPAVKMTVAKGHRADFRMTMFHIVTRPLFDHAIMGAILLNCVVMSATYYGEPTAYTKFCDTLNYAFTALFTLEMIMKIFAFSFSGYWLDSWNRFDFLIVMMCLLDILISDIIKVESFSASVFRLFRIGRVLGRVARMFRVIKNVQSLNQIFQTLIESMPALFYMGILVILIMFIASIMGMHLFGRVVHGEVLGPYANFETVPMGMLTLFGFATGDAVTPLTHDCMVQPPYCSEAENNCGGVVSAKVFFVVYALVMLFVVIEMFVNVIMEKFEEQAELAHLPITVNDMHDFAEVWAHFDPKAHGRIPEELFTFGTFQSPQKTLSASAASNGSAEGFDTDDGSSSAQDAAAGGGEDRVYPGGEERYSMGFLEMLSLKCPVLGCDPEFEARRAVTLGTKPIECCGGSAEERAAWIAQLRVTDGPSTQPGGKGQTRFLKTSHIPTPKSDVRRDVYYSFHEVLYALAHRRAGRSMPLGKSSQELDALRLKLSLKMPTVRLETIDEIIADRSVQSAQRRNAIYLAMEDAVNR